LNCVAGPDLEMDEHRNVCFDSQLEILADHS
jgi:hypothetical protein